MSKSSRRHFPDQLAALGFASYNEYLRSDHWADVKRRYYASKLYRGQCYACGRQGPFSLHHRTYKRLGREWLMDLVAVCQPCHVKAHQLEGSTTRVNLWNSVKRVRSQSAGGGKRAHHPHRRGVVRAV